MKKRNRIETSPSNTDPRRRQLLALAGLAGISHLAWSQQKREKPSCLLSLREADFYAKHDLAG